MKIKISYDIILYIIFAFCASNFFVGKERILELVDFGSESGLSYVAVRYDGAYDLQKTLECGQCFRWERVEDSQHECEYVGVAYGRLISVAKDGDTLTFYNADKEDIENIWIKYFALEEDYGQIDSELLSNCESEVFREALKLGRGIRILHQDPWETLCSFIISQNNNIPRIKKIINSLSESLGERIECAGMESHGGNKAFYSFPSAASVVSAGEKHIFDLKTGFRAKYIIDAAQKWSDGTVDPACAMKITELEEAIEYLCTIKGVGRKVACCSLLFGFERYDPFPVDVWMKRVLEKYFEADFSPTKFGRYAGVAQQYLFDYERNLAQ